MALVFDKTQVLFSTVGCAFLVSAMILAWSITIFLHIDQNVLNKENWDQDKLESQTKVQLVLVYIIRIYNEQGMVRSI